MAFLRLEGADGEEGEEGENLPINIQSKTKEPLI